MALSRSTALLSTAGEVVDLTGVQDLANLEAGSEFSVADTLLRAHEWVYDMVEQRLGASAPAKITNETRLERAVAARFLELLHVTGYLGDGDPDQRDYWQREARDEVDRYRPELSSGDEPRRAGEAIPLVGNYERGLEYDRNPGWQSDRVETWLPEIR